MFTHNRVRRAGSGERQSSPSRSAHAWIAAAAVSGLLAGCTAISAPLSGPDPSDPNVRVPPTSYRSTIGSYSSQRPVSPSDWRQQNEQVAPRSGQ